MRPQPNSVPSAGPNPTRVPRAACPCCPPPRCLTGTFPTWLLTYLTQVNSALPQPSPHTHPRSALPEAGAACSRRGPKPQAPSTGPVPGPGDSPRAGGCWGARAPAPRSTPSSPCSPSGRAPGKPGPGAGEADAPGAGPPPSPGRLRRLEGGWRRPQPVPSRSLLPRHRQEVGGVWGPPRGGDTGALTQPVTEGDPGAGGVGRSDSRVPGTGTADLLSLKAQEKRQTAREEAGSRSEEIMRERRGDRDTEDRERRWNLRTGQTKSRGGRDRPGVTQERRAGRVRSAHVLPVGRETLVLPGARCFVLCPT